MKQTRFFQKTLRFLAAFMIIAVPLSVAAQSKKDRERARKFVDEADKAFQQKKYREAADAYGRAIALDPGNPDAHYGNGRAHLNLKDNADIIVEFTTALSQGYKRPLDVYRLRGTVYRDQKNY